jgi:hypothetical protein
MGMSREIFHKTTVNTHIMPQPADAARQAEPEARQRFGAVFEVRGGLRVITERAPSGGAPVGAIDLCSLNYPNEDLENWGRGVRVLDCAASIDHASDVVVELMSKLLAECLGDLGRDLQKEFNAKVGDLQRENGVLRGAIAEARGEIQALVELQEDLTRQVRQARAVRGAQLPTLTVVKPKIRPKVTPAKRKRAAERAGAMDGAAAP